MMRKLSRKISSNKNEVEMAGGGGGGGGSTSADRPPYCLQNQKSDGDCKCVLAHNFSNFYAKFFVARIHRWAIISLSGITVNRFP